MLNQSAEYGLRAAVHLATLPDDEHASASDISERTKVPIPYLQKVLRTLTRAGVLKARRGMGGGFSLGLKQAGHGCAGLAAPSSPAWGSNRCSA